MARVKHIPRRTCIACRQTDAKRTLVRIVRLPDGHIEVDATGKKSGRGAYLCASGDCWARAIERGQIGQALKAPLQPEDRAALVTYGQTLANH